MTIEEMRIRKTSLGYTAEQLSQRSGVPLGTIQKIFSGATASPRYETLQKLEAVLSMPAVPGSSDARPVLRDGGTAYQVKKAEKRFTIDDYRALPDEQRVELIDGVFYDMAAPSSGHQQILPILSHLIMEHLWESGGPCQVFLAPFDVQLDMDEYTMVQPDLSIICDPSKIKYFGCFGAPDLIMEILSPSTARKDMLLKAQKYEHAGVREYWLIDIRKRRILVYEFEKLELPKIYGFDEKIPIGIWGGALELDFSLISERLLPPEMAVRP